MLQVGPEEAVRKMEDLLFSVLVEFVDVLALRGWLGDWGFPFVDLSTPLVLVEALAGVVAFEEFVALEGPVGMGVF